MFVNTQIESSTRHQRRSSEISELKLMRWWSTLVAALRNVVYI